MGLWTRTRVTDQEIHSVFTSFAVITRVMDVFTSVDSAPIEQSGFCLPFTRPTHSPELDTYVQLERLRCQHPPLPSHPSVIGERRQELYEATRRGLRAAVAFEPVGALSSGTGDDWDQDQSIITVPPFLTLSQRSPQLAPSNAHRNVKHTMNRLQSSYPISR